VKIKKLFIALFLVSAAFILLNSFGIAQAEYPQNNLLFPADPEGCTVIIVGKDASVDGSVMSTHTCDCGICDWTFRFVPAADHKSGSVRKIYHISQYVTWPPSKGLKWEKCKDDYTGTDIPQVSHTSAYIHGMFGYMNENQVAIGESIEKHNTFSPYRSDNPYPTGNGKSQNRPRCHKDHGFIS